MKKSFLWLLVIFGFFAIVKILISENTYADSGIENKALASAVIDCYEKNQFKTPVKRSDFYGGISNIMKTGQNIYVPTSFNGDSTAKCDQYVNKLLSNKGVSVPNTTTPSQNVTSFMVGLGYTTTNTNSNGKCVYYKYTDRDNNSTIATQKICASSVNPTTGVIEVDNLEIQDGDSSIVQFQGAKQSSITLDCDVGFPTLGGCGKHSFTKGVTKWDDFVKEIENDLLTNAKTKAFSAGGSEGSYVYSLDGIHEEAVTNTDSYNAATATYNLTVDAASLTNGTRYLTGSVYSSKPTFSDGEQFVLYQNYLVDYFAAEVHCDWNDTEITAYSGSYKKTRLYRDGGFKTCYVKATKNEKKSVGGIDGNKHFGSSCNFDCVVGWLKDSTVTSLPSEILEPGETTTVNPGSGGSTGTTNEGCDSLVDQYTEGNGIGAAQWLLCPAMDNSVYTADWVDTITQDMLEVKADTYKGLDSYWGTVRNIANIVMIAFLLIVIFSQITGYGIDNYGIKKMLPRLIVMAIIVNLSLYICQVAVDLSNIFGEGLRNLFGGLAGPPSGGANYVTGAITGIFAAAAGGGGAAVSAAGTALALGAGGWVAVVIAVIVLALVIVVAVIVLWFMVGARQIIIIFCIVISPLAFATFILPNTQSMFKKWWELFKAALIVFPLCGMVSGVSAMIRTMVKNGNLDLGVAGGLITMVLPFLVFFLLPSLLKSVIAGLGKIGGALTTMGSNFMNGGRTLGQGALRLGQNTETFKNLQSEAARQRQQRNAQRVVDNVNRREASGRTLSDREKMRRLNAQQTLNRMKQEQYMADLGAPVLSDDTARVRAESAKEAQEIKNYADQYGGLTRPQMATELERAVANYNSERSDDNAMRLQAAIMAAESRGMNKEMLNGNLAKIGLSSSDNNDAKILGRMAASQNKVLSQYGKQVGKQSAPEGASVRRMSLDRFAGSQDLVKMSDAFANQGSNVLNGMDDDTLQYIAEHGSSAASTEMLINAANNTTNTKELAQINSMLGASNRTDLAFSAKQLAGMKIGSLNAIKGKVEIKGSPAHQEFVKATNDIANDPSLLASLRPEQKEFFNQVRGDNIFDTGNRTGSRFTVGFN